jgi:hypothetical protein
VVGQLGGQAEKHPGHVRVDQRGVSRPAAPDLRELALHLAQGRVHGLVGGRLSEEIPRAVDGPLAAAFGPV